MNAVDLFVKLSTEPSVLIALLCGAVTSLILAVVVKRVFGVAFLPTLMTLATFFGAATAMFVSGGRVMEFNLVAPGLISACVMGEPSAVDAQAVLNTILFLPFAVSLTFLLRRALRAALICGIAIICLEILQTITNHGVCEFSDVFHNVIGAILGVIVAWLGMSRKSAGR